MGQLKSKQGLGVKGKERKRVKRFYESHKKTPNGQVGEGNEEGRTVESRINRKSTSVMLSPSAEDHFL